MMPLTRSYCFSWLFATSLLLNAAFACSCGGGPEYCPCGERTNVLGIDLGPDYITAALAIEPYDCTGGATQTPFRLRETLFQKPRIDFLVRHEGNEAYKSFMRQGFFNHSVITGRTVDARAVVDSFSIDHNIDLAGNSSNHPTAATTFEQIFLSPAINTSLVSTFSDLRQALNNSLNRDVGEEFILVTRPTYLPDSAQDILEDLLDAAGFNLLQRMRRQSVIMPWSVESPDYCRSDNYILMIGLSGATFEMTLVEEYCKAVIIIAYEADIGLGDDALALKAWGTMTNVTRHSQLNTSTLAAAKSELSRVTTQPYPNSCETRASSLSGLKHERSQAIQQTIERFMTMNIDNWDSEWYGSLPNTIGVLLSGDASETDFAMLKQVILASPKLHNLNVRLLDLHNMPPAQVAARVVADWGIDYPMLPAPGKHWFEESDASDWYEQRSEDVAKFRCEGDGGTAGF